MKICVILISICAALLVVAESSIPPSNFEEIAHMSSEIDAMVASQKVQELSSEVDEIVEDSARNGAETRPDIAAVQTGKLAAPWNDVEVVPKLRDPVHENRHGGPAEKGEKHLAKAMLRIKRNEEIAAKMAAHKVTQQMKERKGKAHRWKAEIAVKKLRKHAKKGKKARKRAQMDRRLKKSFKKSLIQTGKLAAPWNDVEVVPKLRDPVHENRHGGPAEKGEKHLAKAMLRIKRNEEIAAKMAAHKMTQQMKERKGKAHRWKAEIAVKKLRKHAKKGKKARKRAQKKMKKQ